MFILKVYLKTQKLRLKKLEYTTEISIQFFVFAIKNIYDEL